MSEITRREFLVTAATGVTVAALNPQTVFANTAKESTMSQNTPSAFAANHELKPLPFDPAKLDGLSEKLIKSHWENNYGGVSQSTEYCKTTIGRPIK